MFVRGFIRAARNLPGVLLAGFLAQTAFAQGPAILSEPQSQTNYAGGRVSFSVSASGAEPLTYEWYFNETNFLADATTNTLTLTNVQFSHAGGYHVVVTNAEGAITSTVAVLTVLDPVVNLTIGGRDAPDPVTVGQNLVYFLNVTNEGPAIATGVRLTDVLPRKLRFASHLTTTGSCSQTNGIVECELGSLNPGQGATVRVVAVPMAPGLITNVVLVSSRETETVPTNNSLAQITTVLNPTATFYNPEFFLIDEILAAPIQPYPSRTVVSGLTSSVHKVTVTLHNIEHRFPDDLDILLVGPKGQAVMLMSDAIGGNPGVSELTLTFDDAAATVIPNSIATNATLASGSYRCANHGNQPAIEEFINQGNPSMPPPAPLYPYSDLLSVFNGTNPNGTWSLYVADDQPEEGGWIADGWTLNIITIDPIADLVLTQTDSPDPAFVGNTVTYRVGLTNAGPAGATSVWLTNQVPSGFQVVSHSITGGSCTNVNGTIGCDIGTLPSGSGVEFVLQARPLLGGVFSNVVTAGSSVLDLVPTNNVSVEVTTVTPQSDLSITSSSSRNPALLEQPLIYTLVITNLGPNTATGVRITDILPPSAALTSATTSQGSCSNENGTVTCTLGTLASQARATVLLTCRPTALGMITNQVSVAGDQRDVVTANNSAVTVTQVDPAADLLLTMTDTPDPCPLQGLITYNLVVTNRGPSTAFNVFVSDALPSQLEFVLAQTSHGACTNDAEGRVGCVIPELRAGERVNIAITARTRAIGSVFNSAQVTSSPVDPNLANNSATVNSTVVPSSDLALAYAPARATVWQGDTFTYTLLVSNLGPSTATGVRVTDSMPPSLNLFSVTTTQGSCIAQSSGFTCNLGELAVDGRAVIRITTFATVLGLHTNSAVVLGNEQDVEPGNNGASVTTTIIPNSARFANTNIVTIPERGVALTYPSSIEVAGLTTAVQRVRVTLNRLTHTFPDDLDVLLVGPNGLALPLMSDAGGEISVTNIDLTFDEAALTPLGDEERIVSGSFLPMDYEPVTGEFPGPAPAGPYANALNMFAGTDPNGAWSLYVVDDSAKDRGTIAGGWTLEFSTGNPIADLAVGASAAPNPIALGSNVIMTVTVSNRGPAVASEIFVTNVFPPSLSVVSSASTQGSCTNENGVLKCDLGTLLSGSNAVIQITLNAVQLGSDPVTVSGAGNELDVNRSNNVALLVISVEQPPAIVRQPTAQNVSEGETAVFSVTAIGAEPLTFQWTRNGIPVPDATNITLVINNVTAASAGNYRVRVSNRVASVVSLPARLVVLGPPSISEIEDQVVAEDSTSAPIPFEVGDVETPVDALIITGRSSNPALIPDADIFFEGSGSNRVVRVTPAPDQFGTATINITVEDADFGTASEMFVVTVAPVNDRPVLRAIEDQTTIEDVRLSVPFVVEDVDLQYGALIFSATSSNPELVASSGFAVSGTDSNRVLVVTPQQHQFGSTVITLTVTDPAGSSARVDFGLSVITTNDAPFFDVIADLAVDEDSGENIVTISGISAGASNEFQRVRLSAVSGQPGFIPHPIIEYTSPAATAQLKFTPASHATGTIPITVTAHDGQPQNAVFSRTFNVVITAVDDPPDIGAIADLTMLEDTVLGLPIAVSDPDGAVESLGLSGASSNQQLLPDANIQFSGEGAGRSVRIAPLPDRVGTASITLTATDTNGTSVARTFLLTVTPVNDPPRMDDILDVTIPEDSGPHLITLTGIAAGSADESQPLTITAESSNRALVPDPVVTYESPSSTATLALASSPNLTGKALITVTISDGESQTQKVFEVTVAPAGDAPAIAPIPNRTELEDNVEVVPITISDIDTPVGSLTLSATSSDSTLVSDNNLWFEGGGATRNLFILPNPDQLGFADITVTVFDGVNTANRSFRVTFTAVNDRPTLNPLSDIGVNLGSGEFSVFPSGITSGAGNEADAVTLSAVSANTGVVTVRSVSQSPPRIDLRPSPNTTGSSVITVTVTDNGGGNNTFSRTFTVYVKAAANGSPSISDIPDSSTGEDTPITIPFNISDAQTPAGSLVLHATSSNPALVPSANISFGGAAGSRNVTIVPAPNQSGLVTITVGVTDTGFGLAQDSFILNVAPANDAPTISDIGNVTLTEPETVASVPFTISDPDQLAYRLSVSAASSNPALVPATGLTLGGSGTNRMLVINAIEGQTGSALISVQVTDGIISRADSFTFTVNGINEPPTISTIADQSTSEDTPTARIAFQIGDLETPAADLALTISSSNTELVPNENILLEGSGADRTLVITPATNLFGTANITIEVADPNNAIVTTTFTLAVAPVNEAPALNPIADVVLNQNGAPQVVSLTGINAGALNENDLLLVTAVSGNLNVVAPPLVTYTSPEASGSLTLTPVPRAIGETTVSVIVNDGQGTNNLATNVFRVVINGAPVISDIPDHAIPEESGELLVNFTVSDDASAADDLVFFLESSDQNVVPDANLALGGAGAERFVSLTPITNGAGPVFISVTAVDPFGARGTSTFQVVVVGFNDLPQITSFANQTINEDESLQPLAFQVSDIETPAGALVILGTSSDPALVPNQNIVISGAGADRFLTVTPAPDRSGAATITVTVQDADGGRASAAFELIVNPVHDPITFEPIADRSTVEDQPVTVPLLITQPSVGLLRFAVQSGDQTLVPNTNLVVTVNGTNITLNITPAADQFGTNTISITASTADESVTHTFGFGVAAVNDRPRFVPPIADLITPEETPLAVPVTIMDPETPAGDLLVEYSASSGNLAEVVLAGSGSNRTLHINPLPNQHGTLSIEIRARDPEGQWATNAFTVSIIPIEELPVISSVPDQTMLEDGELSLEFSVGDADEPAENLVLTAAASNPDLFRTKALVVSGSGGTRKLIVRPDPNQFGSSAIIVSVQDSSSNVVSTLFLLTVDSVNDLPVMSGLANLQTTIGQPVSATFTIFDVETPLSHLAVTAQSSNPALLPSASIQVDTVDTNSTVRLNPIVDQFGFALVTIFVTDTDGGTATNVIELLVHQTNGPPVIVQQPQSQVATGGAVTFRVVATGPGPIAYQWHKNGTPLLNETNSTLNFVSVSRTDNGDYDVLVSNPVGSLSSATASLRVLEVPRILALTHGGDTARFTFQSVSGQRYIVEYQDSLNAGPWSILQELDGIDNLLTVIDPSATSRTRFYRIRVE